ncbi:MAG: hypothetical protein ACRD8U_05750 [Pyrinomonadaceae bacterium]
MTRPCSRAFVFSFIMAFLIATALTVMAGPEPRDLQGPTGLITVARYVKVNGQPAATGDIVSSGGTVETVTATISRSEGR